MEKSSSQKKYVTYKDFKSLSRLCRRVIKNQKSIIKTVRAITSFKPTTLESTDADTELVSRPDGRPGVSSVTRERRSSKRKRKPDINDIKTFFHNKGFTLQDDGKKPIKVFDQSGKKVFVVQRSSAIFKKIAGGEYKKVHLEDLV